MARSTLTPPMLERQLVLLRDELQATKRELEAARSGAVQVSVVTPGQLAEIRAIGARLAEFKEYAAAVQSLADSVTGWANQIARIADPQPTAPEESPTT